MKDKTPVERGCAMGPEDDEDKAVSR